MAASSLVDLVKIYATNQGTGALTLGEAVQGYRGVEALLNGATYSYSIQQDAQWEIGKATYLAADNQLVRTPLDSSNGGSTVDFQANAAIAFVALSEDILARDVLQPLYGFGPPLSGQGLIGQTYTDLTRPVTLYGPKTASGWGSGVVLQGSDGKPGTAASYETLDDLRGADPAALFYVLLDRPGGTNYTLTGGDYTGRVDDVNIVKLDRVPLTTGALVRQAAAGVNFDGRSTDAKLRESVSVTDARFAGGAKGDGVTDDYAALQAAIDSTKELRLPPGLYRTSKPLKLHDNLTIYGAGKSAWEPYGGGDFPDDIRSEIIVDGILALNAAGTNNVRVTGLSLKGKGGKQSGFGTEAGFQPGARGVDLAGSYQFEMRDVSFLGLERAFFADVEGSPAQMPSISDWMASDCATVFGFGGPETNTYTARDVRVGECVVALHCNRFFDVHWSDGFRVENCRLFQAFERGMYFRHVPFLSLKSSTIFEGAQDSVTIEDCQYSEVEMLIGRAGAYQTTPAPYPTKQALVMTNCEDFKVGGEIVQPTGRAITLSGCANGEICAAIGTPYWTNGSATNDEGAVTILNSSSIAVHSSFGSNGHWVNVWADAKSAETLGGSIAAHRATGVVRAVNLQQKGGYTYRQAASAEIGPGGAAEFYTLRRFMPAGSVLVTRSVEITTPGLILRANGQDWQQVVEDPGGGTVAFDNRILIDNSNGPNRWASVPLSFFSAAGAALPAGTEVRVSTALLGGES